MACIMLGNITFNYWWADCWAACWSLTLLTLNIRLTARVNHYLNTRLSNQNELGIEYIATEADAFKEESVVSVAETISRLMCWNMAILQQGVQFVRNDKIVEYVEVLTRVFAIPWAKKIPARIDISLVLFPSNQIYCNYTLKKGYLSSYPNQNSISTNGKTIVHSHEPLWSVCYTVQTTGGLKESLMVFQW